MAETDQILQDIDRMTEELERVKKFVLTHAIGKKKRAKAAWQMLVNASKRVKWDDVSAVEEIRQQRGRDQQ